ncbi:glycosyltransferase family 2 protein [Nocardiopsis coralliicola]
MVVVSVVVAAGADEEGQRALASTQRSLAAQSIGADTVETLTADPGGGAGTGGAWNGAARRATGEFLVFLRAGQRMPPHALGAMAAGLRRSGADFATEAPPGSFLETVAGTHVSERPALLGDRSAAGRMWRRGFWTAEGTRFPEQTPIGDMRVTVPAHFRAAAVDVYSTALVLGPDPAAVPANAPPEELFAVVRATSTAVADAAGDTARNTWDAEALRTDLAVSLADLDGDDATARASFAEIANAYIDTVDPRVFRRLPALQRLKWYLVRRHMLEELARVLAFERESGPDWVRADALAVRRGTRWYADYPYLGDPIAAVPQDVYRIDGDMEVLQRAESATADGARFTVSGRLHLAFLPPDGRFRQYLRAYAVNAGTGARARVRVSAHRANVLGLPRGAVTRDRDWGGYEMVVDARDLKANKVWRPGEWSVELWAVNRGVTRRATLAWPAPGAASRPAPFEVEPDVWIRPEWRGADGLRLVVDPLRLLITGAEFTGTGEDTALELHGRAADDVGDGALLRMRRRPGDAVTEVPLRRDRAAGTFAATIPAAGLLDGFDARHTADGGPDSAETWDLYLAAEDGLTECRVALADAAAAGARARVAEDRVVGLVPDGPDWAALRCGLERPVIAGAEWTGGELRVSGPFGGPAGAAELVLTDLATGERTVLDAACDGSDFSAVLAGPDTAPPEGRHRLSLRLTLPGTDSSRRPVDVDPPLLAALPFRGTAAGRPASLDASAPSAPVLTIGQEALPG